MATIKVICLTDSCVHTRGLLQDKFIMIMNGIINNGGTIISITKDEHHIKKAYYYDYIQCKSMQT